MISSGMWDEDELEDGRKAPAIFKILDEEAEEKEDLEEMIESVEDEARSVGEEMEVQMQYESTRLLKSWRVVCSSQRLQNQGMLSKLAFLQGQVNECEAEINRMQDDHEEALAREKERGDRLKKQLQCLKQLYPKSKRMISPKYL
jgi:signal transduction protein with GAF and PtsI domain